MDSLSRILVGLSFIVHASVDEVNARVIPNNIQNRFESYDYHNFFVGGNAIKSQAKSDVDPAEPGRKKIYHLSTQLPPTSKFPKKDDFSFVDNDIIDLYHNVDDEYKDFSDNDGDIKGEDDAEKNWNISIYTDNKGNISIKTIPLQITTQGYISKRSVPNTDDEDLNFFGSGSGSGDGRNAILSPTKRDFKNDNNVNNKKTTRDLISLENKLNSSISDNETVHGNYRKHQNHFANAPRKALNINSSSTDDDDLVISGSGDERNEDAHDNMTFRSSNSNSIFKVTSSTSNKSIRTEDNPVVESNIKNREATKSSENNLSEIITQMPTVETNFFNSDDEDYEFSGSGDDNRDENLVNSKEFFTDKEVHVCLNSIPTVENTMKKIVNDNEAKHSSKTNSFKSTTQLVVSKQFHSTTDDEDYKLFGSGGDINEDEDSLDSITNDQVFNLNDINTLTIPIRTVTSSINNDESEDKEERNLNTSEITSEMPITRIVTPDSDDEDYDFSGSVDENSDTTHYFTNSKEKLHLQSFTTNLTSSVSIPFINYSRKSHSSEVTTEIHILRNVESDDDYEFSGNGDDGSDKNHEDSRNFIMGDRKKYNIQGITTTSPLATIQLEKISQSTSNHIFDSIKHNETASLLKENLTEIITDVHIIEDVIPNGDDEDYELSGSGDGNKVENKANSTDFVSNDKEKVHVQNTANSTTDLLHIMTTFSRTVSIGTSNNIVDKNNKNNEATNSFVDNSTDSTTKLFVIKTFVANNDDEDYEFSGSGDDANSLDSVTGNTAEFNFQYNSSPPTIVSDFKGSSENISSSRTKSGTIYYETTNSLGSNSSRITNEKQILKNVVSNSDNKDEELSGSGDDEDDEYDISVTNDKEKFYVQNTADTTITTPYITTDLAKFSRTVSIESGSNNKNTKATKSSVDNSTDLITKMYVIKTFVANNDDEDYEFSGSGDDANSLDSVTDNTPEFNFKYNSSPPTIVSDFEGSSENISSSRHKSGTIYYETTNSLGSNSSRITNEKQILKNVVSNSDNEDEELSGSGDDDDDEYDISVTNDKEKFYVQNTADTTTTTPYITTGLAKFSRTVSIEIASNNKNTKATKSSVDNSIDLTTKMYVKKTFVATNDDEDYEFSGSGDDAESLDSITGNTAKFNFQLNSRPPTIVTDFQGSFQNISSSRNKSGTKYYETTNSLGSNSSRITIIKKQILKNVISNSDNEDDELSGSGDDDDDEYDIYVTDDKEKFHVQNTADTTTTTIPYITTGLTTFLQNVSIGSTSNNKNKKATNSSVDNSTDLTTKIYVIKNFVANNDDEDYEFSGSANSLDSITGNTAKFNFQYNSSPPTIVTDFEGSFQNISSSRNKSGTKYYETTNSLGSNSSGMTNEKQISKNVVSNSDNEDDESSGSDDDEYDISGSGDEN
ncbi:uncharacterized protein isoform X2 [Leptinotarsa decemlineata]